MKAREVYQCPICNCHNTESQYDHPHMSECNACGSEWITESGEVTLDAHNDVEHHECMHCGGAGYSYNDDGDAEDCESCESSGIESDF